MRTTLATTDTMKSARRLSRMKNPGAASSTGTSSGADRASRRQRESIQSGVTEPVPDHIDLDSIAEVTDENQYLRYSEEAGMCWTAVDDESGGQHPQPHFLTKSVYVRRLKTVNKTPESPPATQRLMLSENCQDEPMQVYNDTNSLVRQKTTALHSHVLRDRCLPALRERALDAQQASLASWEKTLETWDSTRLQISGAVEVPGNSLLMARPLPLPPIQDHLAPSLGPLSDFPQWRQKERFYKNDAFFLLPEYLGPEEDSLMFSLPWSQRQLYQPPVSIVRPNLGEQPPFHDISGSAVQVTKTKQNLVHLHVTGERILAEDEEPEEEVFEEEEEEDSDSVDKAELRLIETNRSVASRASNLRHSDLSGGWASNSRTQYYMRNTVPAFKLDRFVFTWGQPCLQSLVEIGVASNAGERGVTHIKVANVGCCVMRYSWRRLPHQNHFSTGRYRRSPFIFNSSNGSLLPEQTLSIPVQFYSPYAGCWMERWMLRTTPCVYSKGVWGGQEGEIAISLWGQALEVDVNLTSRQQLDAELTDRAVQRMAERYVWDLIRFLPVRSRQRRAEDELQQQQLIPCLAASSLSSSSSAAYAMMMMMSSREELDRVAAFTDLNPGLHYSSAAMVQVMMARFELQHQLHVLAERSRGSNNYVLGDLLTADSGLAQQALGKRGSFSPIKQSPSLSSGTDRSGTDRDKALRRQDKAARSRRINQLGLSPSSTTARSRSRRGSTRRSFAGIPTGSRSSSLFDDELKHLRQHVNLGSVCRETYQVLTEDNPKKEELLAKVNHAILQMSSRPFVPPMRNFKRLVVRAALGQLCDTLAGLEWRLRCSLGLLYDPRFQKLATFPQDLSRATDSDLKRRTPSKGASPTSERRKTNTGVAMLRKLSTRERLVTPDWEFEEHLEPINWEDPLPAQYRRKLRVLVYQLLASELASLLPVATFDGYRLNPFLPPPEI